MAVPGTAITLVGLLSSEAPSRRVGWVPPRRRAARGSSRSGVISSRGGAFVGLDVVVSVGKILGGGPVGAAVSAVLAIIAPSARRSSVGSAVAAALLPRVVTHLSRSSVAASNACQAARAALLTRPITLTAAVSGAVGRVPPATSTVSTASDEAQLGIGVARQGLAVTAPIGGHLVAARTSTLASRFGTDVRGLQVGAVMLLTGVLRCTSVPVVTGAPPADPSYTAVGVGRIAAVPATIILVAA